MTSAIAQLFHFIWLVEAILKMRHLLRVATKAYHLNVFLCLAHLNIQKSF